MAEAGERCHQQLGSATGVGWMQCTIEELLERQRVAVEKKDPDYFPVAPHTFEPLNPVAHARSSSLYADGARNADLLKNLLRNFSCDVEDGGSQPVRMMTWEYQPPGSVHVHV